MVTFTEIESILLNAVKLSENSVKTIAGATGIKASTLYKWKTTDVHLSPTKSDALLLYFLKNEPQAIIAAAVLNRVLELLYYYLSSSTEEDVA